MHDQAFKTLEYMELRALVRRGAQTMMGRARVDQLEPGVNPETLRRDLQAVSECVELRRRQGGTWSFTELGEFADALGRLNIEGSILEPLVLLEVARLCEQALAARAFIMSEREAAPVLWESVAELPRASSLAARVFSKILPGGELDDRASPELARIRADIVRMRSTITRSLETLMRRAEDSIQDELVTVRNERFVIPVRSDHRGRVRGVAHGSSSSGATVFVEPLETIEANNEFQALRETEEREVTRILFTLTEELRAEHPAIEMAARAVAELDFVNAKAALADAPARGRAFD